MPHHLTSCVWSTGVARWLACVAFSFLLFGCGKAEHPLSPWQMSTWVFASILGDQDVEVSRRSVYLTDDVAHQLTDLKALAPALSKVGLLNLNQVNQSTWRGRYGVQVGEWSVPLAFEVGYQNGQWLIQDLPTFEQVKKLLQLSDHLPIVQTGQEWRGGLMGYDLRGRPLSAVLVIWCPPVAFVDGHLVRGDLDQANISDLLSDAFWLRSKLAAQSQASYTPHVTIAIRGDGSAQDLITLVGWAEASGADRVSIVSRSVQRGPVLTYLSPRRDRLSLITPQRQLWGIVQGQQTSFKVKNTDQIDQQDQKRVKKLLPTSDMSSSQTALERFAHLIDHVRTQDHLDGIVIQTDAKTQVKDLIKLVDATRQVAPSLPMTFAPSLIDTLGQP